MTTSDVIKRLRELSAECTPGPWSSEKVAYRNYWTILANGEEVVTPDSTENMRALIAWRASIEALCDVAEAAQCTTLRKRGKDKCGECRLCIALARLAEVRL